MMTKAQRKFFDKLARDCLVDLAMTETYVRFSWSQTAFEFRDAQLNDLKRIERLVATAFASRDVLRERGLIK